MLALLGEESEPAQSVSEVARIPYYVLTSSLGLPSIRSFTSCIAKNNHPEADYVLRSQRGWTFLPARRRMKLTPRRIIAEDRLGTRSHRHTSMPHRLTQ